MSALILRALVAISIALSPALAAAQGLRVVARVNDDAITDFELQQRVIFAIKSSGMQDTPDMHQRLSAQILRQMIDERLQIQNSKGLGVRPTEAEINQRVAAGILTTAKKDGGDYVINGAKCWITNGTRADFITLAVRTGEAGYGGISLVLFPTDVKGFKVARKIHKDGKDWWALDHGAVAVENPNGGTSAGRTWVRPCPRDPCACRQRSSAGSISARAASRSASLPAPSSISASPAVACGTNTCSSPSPPSAAVAVNVAQAAVMSCTPSRRPVATPITSLFMPNDCGNDSPLPQPGTPG